MRDNNERYRGKGRERREGGREREREGGLQASRHIPTICILSPSKYTNCWQVYIKYRYFSYIRSNKPVCGCREMGERKGGEEEGKTWYIDVRGRMRDDEEGYHVTCFGKFGVGLASAMTCFSSSGVREICSNMRDNKER
jgi:hypothetical protein